MEERKENMNNKWAIEKYSSSTTTTSMITLFFVI